MTFSHGDRRNIMASFQNFRSAFNGFNREDVVRYLEMINNKHNAQVNQLNTEIQTLYADIENYRACCESYEEYPALLQKEQDLRRTQHTPALLQAARGIGEGYFSLTAKCFTHSEYHTMDNE